MYLVSALLNLDKHFKTLYAGREEAVEGQPTAVDNLDSVLDTLCLDIPGLCDWAQAGHHPGDGHAPG